MKENNSEQQREVPQDYNPIGCDHKKDNGWSAWEVLSDSNGSGPDVDYQRTIMVCFKCGDIRCVGRELKHGEMNHFDETFDINYPDAVAAIVKACDWFNRDTAGYTSFASDREYVEKLRQSVGRSGEDYMLQIDRLNRYVNHLKFEELEPLQKYSEETSRRWSERGEEIKRLHILILKAFEQGYARRNSNNFGRDWKQFKVENNIE